ncbi:hypothetical protein [Cytobacillus firmus]
MLGLGEILLAVILLVVYLLAGLLAPSAQPGLRDLICSVLRCGV